MFRQTNKNSLIRLTRIAIAVAVILTVISCGKKGPLKLQPQQFPAQIQKLTISQQGQNIHLEWEFPGMLSDRKSRMDMNLIQNIYVYHSEKKIPFEKFRKKADLLGKYEMKSAASNRSYSLTLPFKPAKLAEQTHYFSVSYQYNRKKSLISPVTSFRSQVPPAPIESLKLTRAKKIIKLKWDIPRSDITGESLRKVLGYKIYRKIERTGGESAVNRFAPLHQGLISENYYEDRDTGTDGKYTYHITTFISESIESSISNAVSVQFEDTFPPDIPSNVVLFFSGNQICLSWEKVQDKDLSHYQIYRRTGSREEFSLLAGNVEGNFYCDKNIVRGKEYFYYISAVDQKNNESEASKTVHENLSR